MITMERIKEIDSLLIYARSGLNYEIPLEHKLRWCGGEKGACGCMGCINFFAKEKGISKEEYMAWRKWWCQNLIDDSDG